MRYLQNLPQHVWRLDLPSLSLMRYALSACTAALLISSASAQTPFPSDSLKSATSLAAAFSALGIGRPEFSGYLLLDAPDVAAPGKIKARLRSEIPGTTQLILLRGTPGDPTALVKPPPSNQRSGATVLPQDSALITATRVEPATKPVTISADLNVAGSSQWLTLLAYAQGRWFMVAREVKVGKPR